MVMRHCDRHLDTALTVWGEQAKSFGVEVVDPAECPFCLWNLVKPIPQPTAVAASEAAPSGRFEIRLGMQLWVGDKWNDLPLPDREVAVVEMHLSDGRWKLSIGGNGSGEFSSEEVWADFWPVEDQTK